MNTSHPTYAMRKGALLPPLVGLTLLLSGCNVIFVDRAVVEVVEVDKEPIVAPPVQRRFPDHKDAAI